MTQYLLPLLGMALQLGLLWLAFAGAEARSRGAKRLQSVRERHLGAAPARSAKPETYLRRAPLVSRGPAAAKGRFARLLTEVAHRLHRAGRDWPPERFLMATAAGGLAVMALVYLLAGSLVFALLLGLGATLLGPWLLLERMIGRRNRSFIAHFPEAIELLVCGLRSGLPVSETLGLVAAEVPGPVGQEFRLTTERMRIGRSMEDALQESADRLGIAEFDFFCVTLAIHRETGGNLTETLVNLSEVLRRRGQMQMKIKAMSSESRASAMILGGMPFVVFMLIWTFSPSYIAPFLSDQRLIAVGAGSLTWMALGWLVMAKMVNFKV